MKVWNFVSEKKMTGWKVRENVTATYDHRYVWVFQARM